MTQRGILGGGCTFRRMRGTVKLHKIIFRKRLGFAGRRLSSFFRIDSEAVGDYLVEGRRRVQGGNCRVLANGHLGGFGLRLRGDDSQRIDFLVGSGGLNVFGFRTPGRYYLSIESHNFEFDRTKFG